MAEVVTQIQRTAFQPLLLKYQDYHMSPAMETVEIVRRKMESGNTDSYLFLEDGKEAGWVRITRLDSNVYRVSALCVLPEYQGRKIAQRAMKEIEEYYDRPAKWVLDTILQEELNVHLYEKLGYRRVGEREHVNEKMDLIQFEKDLP